MIPQAVSVWIVRLDLRASRQGRLTSGLEFAQQDCQSRGEQENGNRDRAANKQEGPGDQDGDVSDDLAHADSVANLRPDAH